MNDFPRIEASVYGEPWAISRAGFDEVASIFERAKSGSPSEWVDAYRAAMPGPSGAAPKRKQYEVQDGVAVVPLSGPIFPKANLMTEMSGATSLQKFMDAMRSAMEDPEVKAVLIQSDSPGGRVSGVAEAADELRAMRRVKPMHAIADTVCASAAYWLCAQASQVWATRGAVVGSIGIVAALTSTDRAERNQGMDRTIITTGAMKVPSLNPITTATMANIQASVDRQFAMFKEDIQAGRPGLDLGPVTSGDAWIGSDAMELGLVDGITSTPELVAILSKK